MVAMAFCDMPQKPQKQLTNISLKQFVALRVEFWCLPLPDFKKKENKILDISY